MKPVIGLTSHALSSSLSRSAVVQLYVDAVLDAGGAAVSLPIGLDHDSLRAVYERLDGVLLPGGDDVAPERYGEQRHPMLGAVDESRDDLELTIARWSLADNLPILGICRGIQVLAVAAGGTLVQDLPSEWHSGLPHDVREYGRDHLCHGIAIDDRSLLARSLGATTSLVNSFHHQAVRDLPSCFFVSARSDDGVIEAIERPDRMFALGVQCHPEGMWQTTATEYGGLFRAFVRAAAERAGRRNSAA